MSLCIQESQYNKLLLHKYEQTQFLNIRTYYRYIIFVAISRLRFYNIIYLLFNSTHYWHGRHSITVIT